MTVAVEGWQISAAEWVYIEEVRDKALNRVLRSGGGSTRGWSKILTYKFAV